MVKMTINRPNSRFTYIQVEGGVEVYHLGRLVGWYKLDLKEVVGKGNGHKR